MCSKVVVTVVVVGADIIIVIVTVVAIVTVVVATASVVAVVVAVIVIVVIVTIVIPAGVLAFTLTLALGRFCRGSTATTDGGRIVRVRLVVSVPGVDQHAAG